MKYIVLLLVSLFVVLNADEIAVVKTVKGEVVAKSDSGVVKLKEGSVLSASSIVITKNNALVVIIFKDNSILNLGENTVLNLQKYVFKPTKKDYAFNLFLKKGRLIFESGKIGELAPKDFQLKTPQGIVAIRGTKFAVRVK